MTGAGVGPNAVSRVIGITKAYTTRVGTGPFPTEIEHTEKETAERIRKIGAEFGATTGRPRRTGWLDLVALRYAVEVNGITGLALMKSDVLQEFRNYQGLHRLPLQRKDPQEFAFLHRGFGTRRTDLRNASRLGQFRYRKT